MEHETHQGEHEHEHGPDCGHIAVRHEDHIDYLYEGHLHHPHGDHCDEHVIAIDQTHPDGHTDPVACDSGHDHDGKCGHEAVPHGHHVDYLVEGRLHRPHGDHCDDHGPIATA
jgi:hypothetical protein